MPSESKNDEEGVCAPSPSLNFDMFLDMEGIDDDEMDGKEIRLDDINVEAFGSSPSSDLDDSERTTDDSAKLAQQEGSVVAVIRRKKKPKGMPKRPLSAYNIFFQMERLKLVESKKNSPDKSKIGFQGLAKIIGKRWKALAEEDKTKYNSLAETDSIRYRTEMEAYNELKKGRNNKSEQSAIESADSQELTPESKSSPPEIGTFPGSLLAPLHARMPAGRPPSPRLQPPPSPAPRQISGPSEHPPPQSPQSQRSMPPNMLAWSQAARSSPPVPAAPTSPPTALSHTSRRSSSCSSSNTTPTPDGGAFPVPPGMEVILPDPSGRERKYKVSYSFYSMKREAAEEYVNALAARQHQANQASADSRPARPGPPPQQQVGPPHPMARPPPVPLPHHTFAYHGAPMRGPPPPPPPGMPHHHQPMPSSPQRYQPMMRPPPHPQAYGPPPPMAHAPPGAPPPPPYWR